MILCYNKTMKFLVKLFIIFVLAISPCYAITFDVLVLPSDIFSVRENYYGFNEVSEIIASDIIKNFNSTNGKIKSPDLYAVKNGFAKNPQLKQTVKKALEQYKSSGKIDYEAFKSASEYFSCKSILLVSASVTSDKSTQKRGIWEVLDISSAFKIKYPYRLETSLLLTDNVNNLVMWSNNYSVKLSDNNDSFSASSYTQANEQYEKIKLYSKNIVASSAAQNILLRFFPKSVQPILREINENTGGSILYERNLPDKPKKYEEPQEEFYGEMIYGI